MLICQIPANILESSSPVGPWLNFTAISVCMVPRDKQWFWFPASLRFLQLYVQASVKPQTEVMFPMVHLRHTTWWGHVQWSPIASNIQMQSFTCARSNMSRKVIQIRITLLGKTSLCADIKCSWADGAGQLDWYFRSRITHVFHSWSRFNHLYWK